MSLRREYGKLLSRLLPAGVVGVSMLLGMSAPAGAKPVPSGTGAVAERLAAIRGAVSDLGALVKPEAAQAETRLAWGNWRNWRNGGWRNGGWGNWHNGGWHNGWHNWWHNW
jgi:hypothetical protein